MQRRTPTVVELQVCLNFRNNIGHRERFCECCDPASASEPVFDGLADPRNVLRMLFVVVVERTRQPGIYSRCNRIQRCVRAIHGDVVRGTAEEARLDRIGEGERGERPEDGGVVGDDAAGVVRDGFVCDGGGEAVARTKRY